MSVEQQLFFLKFRGQRGVQQKFITARDLATAERVGRVFCARHSATYMFVEEAVIADERILDEETSTAPASERASDRPSLEEQRERLRLRHAGAGPVGDVDESDTENPATPEPPDAGRGPGRTRTSGPRATA